jgi:hypothetical protein
MLPMLVMGAVLAFLAELGVFMVVILTTQLRDICAIIPDISLTSGDFRVGPL